MTDTNIAHLVALACSSVGDSCARTTQEAVVQAWSNAWARLARKSLRADRAARDAALAALCDADVLRIATAHRR